MLKKLTLCLGLLSLVMIWVDSPNVHSRTEQPPVFNAGAPEMSGCNFSGCHENEINMGPGSITLAVPPELPSGTTVTIDVTVSEPDIERYGFQMVALDENGESVGQFITDEENGIGTQFAQGFQFVNHFMIPEMNSGTWTVEYNVPEDQIGEVSFYAAGVAANGNMNPTEDNSYSTSATSMWVMDSGIEEELASSLDVFPNPSTDFIQVTSELPANDFLNLHIYNAAGEMIQTHLQYQGEKIDVSNLSSGMYMATLKNEAHSISKKFLVK